MGLSACTVAQTGGDSLDSHPSGRRTDSGTDEASPLPDRADTGTSTDAGARDATTSHDSGFDASARGAIFCNATGLALCLPFESEAVDRSANNLALSVSGLSFVEGHEGKAARFGASSFLRIGANPIFDTAAATIEAWVNRDAGTGGVVFDADGRYSLTIGQTGVVLCNTSNGDVAEGTAPAGQWVHVACVIGGGRVRVYIDGAQRDDDGASLSASSGSTEAVGGNAPNGEPFIGAIDSLRVFAIARTPEEIAAAAAP